MKKHRQLTILCFGLLIVSFFLTDLAPIAVHNLAGRKVLKTLGTYYCTEYCRTSVLNVVSYRKYDYTGVNLTNNTYFNRATSEDLRLVREYTEGFLDRIDLLARGKDRNAAYLIEHYDFDQRCISDGDYVYFQEHIPHVSNAAHASFLFYFFDTESHTMYYFEYISGLEGITLGNVTLSAVMITALAASYLIILPAVPWAIFAKMISSKK